MCIRDRDTAECGQMNGGEWFAVDGDRQQELQGGRQVLNQANSGQTQQTGGFEKHQQRLSLIHI